MPEVKLAQRGKIVSFGDVFGCIRPDDGTRFVIFPIDDNVLFDLKIGYPVIYDVYRKPNRDTLYAENISVLKHYR